MTLPVPDTIEFSLDSGIGTVRIDRPPVNALAEEQYQSYAEFFETLNCVDDLQSVVVESGGERAFIAGHDLEEGMDVYAAEVRRMSELSVALIERIGSLQWPVIAAVDGPALGVGFSMAAAADIRCATQAATFGLPEVEHGSLSGYSFAQAHFPEGVARKMLFTADPISAEMARDYGFVQELLESDEKLHTRTHDLATTIADHPRQAVKVAKRSVVETAGRPLYERFAMEGERSVKLHQHFDGDVPFDDLFGRPPSY